MKTLAERCASINLLVLDVDGVLTDGRIIYTDGGDEIKAFHVRDGSGIKAWQSVGKEVAIISGRSSAAVERRAAELGIRHILQGVDEKHAAYRSLLTGGNQKSEQACCIGDDIPDLSLLGDCGLAVAVADACIEVRAAAHWLTQASGGYGAARETIELILRMQGYWPRIVEPFRRAKDNGQRTTDRG